MSSLVPYGWRNSLGELNRNLNDVFGRWWPRRHEEGESTDIVKTWPVAMFEQGGPAIDVSEDDDAIHVAAELPGLDEKDFSVEVEANRLILRGEKKNTHESKGKGVYYSECSYGSFMRAVPLPSEVDANNTKATYKNGVLRVDLPKTEEAKARRIRVNVS